MPGVWTIQNTVEIIRITLDNSSMFLTLKRAGNTDAFFQDSLGLFKKFNDLGYSPKNIQNRIDNVQKKFRKIVYALDPAMISDERRIPDYVLSTMGNSEALFWLCFQHEYVYGRACKLAEFRAVMNQIGLQWGADTPLIQQYLEVEDVKKSVCATASNATPSVTNNASVNANTNANGIFDWQDNNGCDAESPEDEDEDEEVVEDEEHEEEPAGVQIDREDSVEDLDATTIEYKSAVARVTTPAMSVGPSSTQSTNEFGGAFFKLSDTNLTSPSSSTSSSSSSSVLTFTSNSAAAKLSSQSITTTIGLPANKRRSAPLDEAVTATPTPLPPPSTTTAVWRGGSGITIVDSDNFQSDQQDRLSSAMPNAFPDVHSVINTGLQIFKEFHPSQHKKKKHSINQDPAVHAITLSSSHFAPLIKQELFDSNFEDRVKSPAKVLIDSFVNSTVALPDKASTFASTLASTFSPTFASTLASTVTSSSAISASSPAVPAVAPTFSVITVTPAAPESHRTRSKRHRASRYGNTTEWNVATHHSSPFSHNNINSNCNTNYVGVGVGVGVSDATQDCRTSFRNSFLDNFDATAAAAAITNDASHAEQSSCALGRISPLNAHSHAAHNKDETAEPPHQKTFSSKLRLLLKRKSTRTRMRRQRHSGRTRHCREYKSEIVQSDMTGESAAAAVNPGNRRDSWNGHLTRGTHSSMKFIATPGNRDGMAKSPPSTCSSAIVTSTNIVQDSNCTQTNNGVAPPDRMLLTSQIVDLTNENTSMEEILQSSPKIIIKCSKPEEHKSSYSQFSIASESTAAPPATADMTTNTTSAGSFLIAEQISQLTKSIERGFSQVSSSLEKLTDQQKNTNDCLLQISKRLEQFLDQKVVILSSKNM